MFPILNLWTAHERGEPDETRRRTLGPPPHLQGRTWKFVCRDPDAGCGYVWHATADAVWDEREWRGPSQVCIGCRTWVTGRPV